MTVNPALIEAIIAAVGVLMSAGISVFVAGYRTGKLEAQITSMSRDISEIKGMFVLRLRDNDGPAR